MLNIKLYQFVQCIKAKQYIWLILYVNIIDIGIGDNNKLNQR